MTPSQQLTAFKSRCLSTFDRTVIDLAVLIEIGVDGYGLYAVFREGERVIQTPDPSEAWEVYNGLIAKSAQRQGHEEL